MASVKKTAVKAEKKAVGPGRPPKTVTPDAVAVILEARRRAAAADAEAVRARADYVKAVQAAHAGGAGASIRSIAEAMGISHQRVHQIVHND